MTCNGKVNKHVSSGKLGANLLWLHEVVSIWSPVILPYATRGGRRRGKFPRPHTTHDVELEHVPPIKRKKRISKGNIQVFDFVVLTESRSRHHTKRHSSLKKNCSLVGDPWLQYCIFRYQITQIKKLTNNHFMKSGNSKNWTKGVWLGYF